MASKSAAVSTDYFHSLILMGILATGIGVFCLTQAANAQDKPKSEKQPPARTDRYGDPLPAGAVARIGAVRFRRYNRVQAVCYSPDGKSLATIGDEGVHLWDAASGKEIHSYDFHTVPKEDSFPLAGYDRGFFSPDGRGLWLQSASAGQNFPGREIYFWKLAPKADRKPRKAPFEGKDLHLLAPSPEGKFLAIGEKNIIRICNAATGEDSRRLKAPGYRAGYSADGKMLASSGDRDVILWNVRTREQIRSFRAANERDFFTRFALAPDGKTLAAYCHNPRASIHLLETATGKELQLLQVADSSERDMAISPDGKTFVYAGQMLLCAWDVSSGKLLWEHHERYSPFHCVAFSPDSKTLAAGVGIEVRRYDAATGRERPPISDGEAIMGLGLLGDGRTVVSTAPAKPFRLWRLPRGEEILPESERKRPIVPIVDDVSPDGKLMASSGHADGAVRIWDLASGKEIRRLSRVKNPACSFSPDGRWLQTHDYVHDPKSLEGWSVLRFWDAHTGEMVSELKGKQASVIRFSPDGRLYATQGARQGVCYLATVPDGLIVRAIAVPNGSIRFSFSADGRLLAGAGQGEVTPHVWETASGKEVAVSFDKPKDRRGRGWPQMKVRFSPDGRNLIAGDSDGNLFYWDVEGRLIHQWRGDGFPASCLDFTPDGKMLVTGGNTTGLVWNMDEVLPREGRRTITLLAADLNALWSDLKAEDATRAYRAIWKLSASPQQAVAFLRERLRAAREPDKTNAARIVQLIGDLDSDAFAVREKASRELASFGRETERELRKALVSSPSAESKRRIEELLRKLPESLPSPPPEQLRQLRALAVLEDAATPEAKQFLQMLASGSVEARLTREAKASLERLARKSNTAP
jgi:WD40 repeat protein